MGRQEVRVKRSIFMFHCTRMIDPIVIFQGTSAQAESIFFKAFSNGVLYMIKFNARSRKDLSSIEKYIDQLDNTLKKAFATTETSFLSINADRGLAGSKVLSFSRGEIIKNPVYRQLFSFFDTPLQGVQVWRKPEEIKGVTELAGCNQDAVQVEDGSIAGSGSESSDQSSSPATAKCLEVSSSKQVSEFEGSLSDDAIGNQTMCEQCPISKCSAQVNRTVRVYPRSTRKGGNGSSDPIVITFDLISSNFHLPLPKAAEQLGLGCTAFKHACRKFGVLKWPYKRIKQKHRKFSANKKPHIHDSARKWHLIQGCGVLVEKPDAVQHSRVIREVLDDKYIADEVVVSRMPDTIDHSNNRSSVIHGEAGDKCIADLVIASGIEDAKRQNGDIIDVSRSCTGTGAHVSSDSDSISEYFHEVCQSLLTSDHFVKNGDETSLGCDEMIDFADAYLQGDEMILHQYETDLDGCGSSVRCGCALGETANFLSTDSFCESFWLPDGDRPPVVPCDYCDTPSSAKL